MLHVQLIHRADPCTRASAQLESSASRRTLCIDSDLFVPAADVSASGMTDASAVVRYTQPAYSTVVIQVAKPGQRIISMMVSHVRRTENHELCHSASLFAAPSRVRMSVVHFNE